MTSSYYPHWRIYSWQFISYAFICVIVPLILIIPLLTAIENIFLYIFVYLALFYISIEKVCEICFLQFLYFFMFVKNIITKIFFTFIEFNASNLPIPFFTMLYLIYSEPCKLINYCSWHPFCSNHRCAIRQHLRELLFVSVNRSFILLSTSCICFCIAVFFESLLIHPCGESHARSDSPHK